MQSRILAAFILLLIGCGPSTPDPPTQAIQQTPDETPMPVPQGIPQEELRKLETEALSLFEKSNAAWSRMTESMSTGTGSKETLKTFLETSEHLSNTAAQVESIAQADANNAFLKSLSEFLTSQSGSSFSMAKAWLMVASADDVGMQKYLDEAGDHMNNGTESLVAYINAKSSLGYQGALRNEVLGALANELLPEELAKIEEQAKRAETKRIDLWRNFLGLDFSTVTMESWGGVADQFDAIIQECVSRLDKTEGSGVLLLQQLAGYCGSRAYWIEKVAMAQEFADALDDTAMDDLTVTLARLDMVAGHSLDVYYTTLLIEGFPTTNTESIISIVVDSQSLGGNDAIKEALRAAGN